MKGAKKRRLLLKFLCAWVVLELIFALIPNSDANTVSQTTLEQIKEIMDDPIMFQGVLEQNGFTAREDWYAKSNFSDPGPLYVFTIGCDSKYSTFFQYKHEEKYTSHSRDGRPYAFPYQTYVDISYGKIWASFSLFSAEKKCTAIEDELINLITTAKQMNLLPPE